jgi:DNA-binding transcriptional LysR family regulator
VASLKQPCNWQDLDWVCWGGECQHLPPRSLLEKAIADFLPAFESNDYLTQKAATLAGVGAMMTVRPFGLKPRDLSEIGLVESLPKAKFYLVRAKSTQHVPRVAAVVKALIEIIELSE